MRRRQPSGMTLAETLVSLAIMAILGLILVQIYDVSRQAYSKGTAQLAVQQKARILMDRLSSLVLSATPPDEESKALYSSTPSSLVFYVPDKDFNPRSPTYTRIGIYHQDTTVRLVNSILEENYQEEAFRTRDLAYDIYDLRFGLPSDNVVKILINVYGTSRTAGNEDALQRYTLEGLVQIPYYSKN